MKSATQRAAITGIAAGLLGCLASILPQIASYEESLGLRYLYAVRGHVEPPADVLIVGISEESLRALGLPQSLDDEVGLLAWPRNLYPPLIGKIDAWGAATIVLDVHFRDLDDTADDAALARAISDAGSVILFQHHDRAEELLRDTDGPAILLQSHDLVPPHPEFAAAALAYAPFSLPTEPHLTNGYWTFMPLFDDRPTIPTVALTAMAGASGRWLLDQLLPESDRRADGSEAADLPEQLAAAHRRLLREPEFEAGLRAGLERRAQDPMQTASANRAQLLLDLLAGPNARYLNYYGPPRTIRTISAHELLARDRIDEIDWRDAAVFIGLSSETQPPPDDEFRTFYTQPSGREINGVEIAATALANLLEQRALQAPMDSLSLSGLLAVYLIAGLVLGAGFLARSAAMAMTSIGLLLGAYLVFVQLQFNLASVWLPVVTPVLLQTPLALFVGLSLLYRHARTQHEAVARGAGLFLPPDLLRRIEQDPTAIRAAELTSGVCMVTDIEQYTAFSESLSPATLKTRLDTYYETLFSIVRTHHGLVTDIVGDSMVAVWSGPAETCREQALSAALAIASQLGQGDASFPRTRVGLQAGEFMLGAVGASERLEYRAVGDSVNSAARIQALNKLLGTTVLAAREALPAAAPQRELGRFQLPGKSRLIDICEPRAASILAADANFDAEFGAALADFAAGEPAAALDRFRILLGRCPADGPTLFFTRYLRESLADNDAQADPVVRIRG